MELLESLSWRYATKQMSGRQIDPQITSQILQAIRLAPSSYGLTPYRIINVQDPVVRAELLSACYYQPQVVQCSSLLIFCAKTDISQNTIDEFISSLSEFRGQTPESLSDYRQAIVKSIEPLSQAEKINWAHRQAYIALGFGLVASSCFMVDSTPMEGFSAQKVDEILNLSQKNLTSSCILALGYRNSETDYLVNLPKFRFPEDELFINI